MTRHQVRRVPIIDTDGRLLGIIAQADLALASDADGDVRPLDLPAEVVRSGPRPERRKPRSSN